MDAYLDTLTGGASAASRADAPGAGRGAAAAKRPRGDGSLTAAAAAGGKKARAGAPAVGSWVATTFDDGVEYAGRVVAVLSGSRARVRYDDGDSEMVTFPDASVRVTRVGPTPAPAANPATERRRFKLPVEIRRVGESDWKRFDSQIEAADATPGLSASALSNMLNKKLKHGTYAARRAPGRRAPGGATAPERRRNAEAAEREGGEAREAAAAARPPAAGSRVAVTFDDGVAYAGTVEAVLAGGAARARVRYDDGDVEVVAFPDASVEVLRSARAPPPPPRRAAAPADSAPPPVGSWVATTFDDGVEYSGKIVAVLAGSRARVRYDDGDSETVTFPDAKVRITRGPPDVAAPNQPRRPAPPRGKGAAPRPKAPPPPRPKAPPPPRPKAPPPPRPKAPPPPRPKAPPPPRPKAPPPSALFGVGDAVEARWKGRRSWWRGVVEATASGGAHGAAARYDVRYMDGVLERGVPGDLVRRLFKSVGKTLPKAVEVRARGAPKWHRFASQSDASDAIPGLSGSTLSQILCHGYVSPRFEARRARTADSADEAPKRAPRPPRAPAPSAGVRAVVFGPGRLGIKLALDGSGRVVFDGATDAGSPGAALPRGAVLVRINGLEISVAAFGSATARDMYDTVIRFVSAAPRPLTLEFAPDRAPRGH